MIAVALRGKNNIALLFMPWMSEIVKSLRNDGKRVEYTLYYYRDRDQKEVDILYIKDQTIYPIEIKKDIGKNNS